MAEKKKNKFWFVFRIILMVILVCAIGYSAYNIIVIQKEYSEGIDTFNSVSEDVVKKIDVPDSVNSDIPIDELDIEVDFDALKKKNSDVIGWIYLKNSVVNYPVLQGKTNNTYLRHMINHKYNTCGSIFLDSSDSKDFSDAHSRIYGHNMRNGTMFATINKYEKPEFYQENKIIFLLTPDKNYVLLPISGYAINSGDDMTYNKFDDAGILEFIDAVEKKSDFQTEAEYVEGDKIVTLSTCEYTRGYGRYVLHCLLREYE